MYTCPIEMNDVRYNAATQSFEAAVTVHDNSTVRSYPCAVKAPLSLNFEDAAKRLTKQAIRRHQRQGGLFSEIRSGSIHRWLQDVIRLPERSVA